MPAGVVYHWKHGWIPLTHEAALSKAKGNHERAASLLSAAHSGDAGIHTRQDVAKAIRGLPDVPSEHRDHARAQVIDAAHQHNSADLLPSTMRRQQVGITQANHRAFGNNVEGRPQAESGGYREGQRVEHQVMNFSKPGFPTEWQPGTVEKVARRPDGLTELTVRHDNGTATVEMIGKRGGNKKLRPLTTEPGPVADHRAVTAQQKAFDRIQQAHTARASNPVEYQYHPGTENVWPRVTAHRNGVRIGEMSWHPEKKHVTWTAVYDQENRRQGIASGMFHRARQADPQVKHQTDPEGLTAAGAAFSKSAKARPRSSTAAAR